MHRSTWLRKNHNTLKYTVNTSHLWSVVVSVPDFAAISMKNQNDGSCTEKSMDTLAIDEVSVEFIPRDMSCITPDNASTEVHRPALPFALSDDDEMVAIEEADAAIAIVSETGQALRTLEEMSKRVIEKSLTAAMEAKGRLERAEDYAAKAEVALQQAESEIKELTTSVKIARGEIESLKDLIATKDEDHAAMVQRATAAEKRANDANAAIEQILSAIRTQLPIASYTSEPECLELEFI